MRVLVTGGTGFIGRHLCRELHERGHEVNALARNPEGTDLPDGVTTVAGDVTDYDSVEGAFEGRDAVVNLVALSPLFRPRGGYQRHFEVHTRGTENVVRAAEAHGVSKLVQMSGVGADPDASTTYLRSKGAAEELVTDSSLEWVIFRPDVVFGEGDEFVGFTKLLAPPYVTPLPGGGETEFKPIWVGDLAPMLADATDGTAPDDESDEDPHVGEVYEIAGPEVLTLAEVAKLAHAADGRPVNVVPLPMPLAKVGLSVADYVPRFPFGSEQYRSLQLDNIRAENDVDAFGFGESDLRTLDSYLGVGPEILAR